MPPGPSTEVDHVTYLGWKTTSPLGRSPFPKGNVVRNMGLLKCLFFVSPLLTQASGLYSDVPSSPAVAHGTALVTPGEVEVKPATRDHRPLGEGQRGLLGVRTRPPMAPSTSSPTRLQQCSLRKTQEKCWHSRTIHTAGHGVTPLTPRLSSLIRRIPVWHFL